MNIVFYEIFFNRENIYTFENKYFHNNQKNIQMSLKKSINLVFKNHRYSFYLLFFNNQFLYGIEKVSIYLMTVKLKQ